MEYKEDLKYRKILSGLFASGAIFFYGAIIFLQAKSFDPRIVVFALKKLTLVGIFFGLFGFSIGKIIDISDKKRKNVKKV